MVEKITDLDINFRIGKVIPLLSGERGKVLAEFIHSCPSCVLCRRVSRRKLNGELLAKIAQE